MNLKRKRAKVKLRKSIYFSLYVTTATVSVGVAVSVPVFLKVRKELNSAIKEAASINSELLDLASELGLKNDDDVIKKIPGGYYLHYKEGKAEVYVQDKKGNKNTMFEILGSGKIVSKYSLTGNSAKTIVSIIAMIKKFLFVEMQAEKDILLPFVREIIKKEIESENVTGARQIAQDIAKPILGDNFAYKNKLKKWEKLFNKQHKKDEDNLEIKNIVSEIRPSMRKGILAFYEGYNLNSKEIIADANTKLKNSEKIVQNLKKLLGASSKVGLEDTLKYNGYEFRVFIKYFEAAKLGLNIINDINTKKKIKSDALLKEFEGDVSDENIFKKISADFGNTFVAFSKTYGFKHDNGEKISASSSIRNKLSKYLFNLGLTKRNFENIIEETKRLINYHEDDEIGKYILDSSATKKIVIGDKVYSLLTISSYENEENKKLGVPLKTIYYVIRQKSAANRLWNIEIHETKKEKLKQLIKLSDVIKFSDMHMNKANIVNLNLLIKDFVENNKVPEWKKVDFIWKNISKQIVWKYFLEALNQDTEPIYKSLSKFNKIFLKYTKPPEYYKGSPDKYEPYANDFINDFDGSVDQFTFKFLDKLNSVIYEGSQSLSKLLHEPKKSERIKTFIKAVSIAVKNTGFSHVLEKITNFGRSQIADPLNKLDFNNLDIEIKKLAKKYGWK